MHLISVLPLIALPLSLAKNISISVGQNGLVFNPEVVTADSGDLLQFHYYPKNHSVTQGSFSSPCRPLTGGVYSGFMPETAEGTTIFQVAVNNTAPIYFYCSQVTHCQSGMAMVVNAPSNNTLATYKSAAKNTTASVSPPAIAGGVFLASTASSTSASNTTTTSGASTSTSPTTSPTSSTVASQGGAAGNSFMQCGLPGWIAIGGLIIAMIWI